MNKKIQENIKNTSIYLASPKNILNERFKTIEISDDEKNKSFISTLKKEGFEEHPFEYKLVEDLTKKFGLINAIVEKITDFTIGPGVYIESEDENIVEILDEWMEETNFRYYLRPWAKEALIKGSGYLEIAGLGMASKINTIKCVNANNMFVKKDEFGEIKGYTQYLGNSYIGIDKEKKIDLSKDEIIQLDFNKIGTCGYGYGIVYSALETVDYFLSSQKSMHKIMSRKANSQVHWKLGNAEKDDYPKQEDIDAFAGKLQFMNDTTEFVTGPNAEAKVIDFGNIGEKFAEVLANDYKLLSYCFQVPEMLLGSDRGWSGSSEVQMDAFERNCKSKQEEIGCVLRYKVFNKVLEANGIKDYEYELVWGQPSEDDKNKELETYREILKIPGLNPGLTKAIEKKLACVLDIDYDEVYEEPIVPTDANGNPIAPQLGNKPGKENPNKEEPMEEPEEEEEMEENKHYVVNSYKINDFIEKLKINLKGNYRKDLEHSFLTHKQEKLDLKDYTIKEYLNKDYKQFKEGILNAIEKDEFTNIKAENKVELKAGYLSETKLNRFREVLKEGIENDKSLKAMKKDMLEVVKVPALYEYNRKGLIKDEKGRKILLLSADERAEMILKTELIRLSGEGFIAEVRKEGETLVEWITAEDERVCTICEDLDKRIFEVDSVLDNYPAHVNCRCMLERVSIEEKQKVLRKILEDTKLAPQEKDAKICKLFRVEEKDLAKLIEETLNGKIKMQ